MNATRIYLMSTSLHNIFHQAWLNKPSQCLKLNFIVNLSIISPSQCSILNCRNWWHQWYFIKCFCYWIYVTMSQPSTLQCLECVRDATYKLFQSIILLYFKSVSEQKQTDLLYWRICRIEDNVCFVFFLGFNG